MLINLTTILFKKAGSRSILQKYVLPGISGDIPRKREPILRCWPGTQTVLFITLILLLNSVKHSVIFTFKGIYINTSFCRSRQ